MTNRFYITQQLPNTGGEINISDKDLLKQITAVLRMKQGDKIFLFDGSGDEAETEITEISKNSCCVSVIKKLSNESEPSVFVSLYCAILKKENFELVAQKAVEVGVSRIVPIITERTIKLNLNKERILKIIKEAAEQSGRAILPELSEPMKFSGAAAEASNVSTNLFFDITGKSFFHLDIGCLSGKINIFIGPEGGWSQTELVAAQAAKFTIASLSPSLTLRAETAAITASYMAVNFRK